MTMPRPSRRFVVIGALILLFFVGGFGANILLGVKRAADDVGVMMLPTVVIPNNIYFAS